MRISDWSSDVCSSDLFEAHVELTHQVSIILLGELHENVQTVAHLEDVVFFVAGDDFEIFGFTSVALLVLRLRSITERNRLIAQKIAKQSCAIMWVSHSAGKGLGGGGDRQWIFGGAAGHSISSIKSLSGG